MSRCAWWGVCVWWKIDLVCTERRLISGQVTSREMVSARPYLITEASPRDTCSRSSNDLSLVISAFNETGPVLLSRHPIPPE